MKLKGLLALLLLGVSSVAAADPKEVGNLGYALSSENWASCVTEVDAALAAGDTPDTIVNLWYSKLPGAAEFTSSNGNHQWQAPLSAVRKHCVGKEAEWQTRVMISDIESTLASAKEMYETYFTSGDDVSWDAWDTLERVAKKCPAQIDAALAAGVESSHPLELRTGEKTTLGAASATYCEPLVTAVTALLAKNAAEAEAHWAPYKKLLKGSKLDLVLARGTDGWYGKGCKQLSTAKQLAKAKVWYEVSVDTSGYEPRWTLRAYKFKGNKLASTKDKSGRGNDAPSSACR
jgi:hypothetical protein